MFESVVIRRPIFGDKQLDAGLIAEVLLFYQNVHLVLDHGSIISIANVIGIDNLLRLVEDGHMKASFMMETLGTSASTKKLIPLHNFLSIQFAQENGGLPPKEEALQRALERALGSSLEAEKATKQLEKQISIEKFEFSDGKPMDIVRMAREDLRDSTYVNPAIKLVLQELVPSLKIPVEWNFQTREIEDGFIAITNFDFGFINAEYHQYVSPKHSSITPAFLLNHILDARADILLAGKHTAELVTTPMASSALAIKFSTILEKRLDNAKEIELFQHAHLDAKAVRDVINSGERNFSEFIDVLEQAQKFKAWLKDADPEIGLVQEYYKSATAETWVEKLPGKTSRFAFFTGAGFLVDVFFTGGLGTLTGLGLSAADAFLIDKLAKGWRPSHFVEEKLSEFADPGGSRA